MKLRYPPDGRGSRRQSLAISARKSQDRAPRPGADHLHRPKGQDDLSPVLESRAPDAYCFTPAESVAKRNEKRRPLRRRRNLAQRRKARPERIFSTHYERSLPPGDCPRGGHGKQDQAQEHQAGIEPAPSPIGAPTSCDIPRRPRSAEIRTGGRADRLGPCQGRRNLNLRQKGLCPCGFHHGENRIRYFITGLRGSSPHMARRLLVVSPITTAAGRPPGER